MDVYCTRPGCHNPINYCPELDHKATLHKVQQKYCTSCGMTLILRGRYLPIKLLGKGGFGTAFLARDRDTPAMRYCAIKLFQPDNNLNPQQLAVAQNLFEREAAVLEELGNKHPLIPDLLAFFSWEVPSLIPGREERFFYLVQEFIDGENLEEELTKTGVFSQDKVLEMLTEILNVIQFVHKNGVIHRDIKLSNIIHHHTNGHFYLLDFGAVKQVTQVPAGTSKQSSTGIYSMGFAPPEQMSGNQIYPSTDLYALAVTCVILLTGKQPQVLLDSYTNQWHWQKYAPQVSDRFAQVLNKMLNYAPNQRFDSAADVLAALQPVFSSTTPTPPSLPTPVISSTPQKSLAIPHFSNLELLAAAGFTGFEVTLLGFIFINLFGQSWLSGIVGALILFGLIFTQSRRIIEGNDLIIISGLTLAIIMFLPTWQLFQPISAIIIISMMAGLSAIAVTALFRLIYILLSRIL